MVYRLADAALAASSRMATAGEASAISARAVEWSIAPALGDQEGAIGRIVSIEENFLRAPYGVYARKPGLNEVEWQGSNQYHFHWLCGDDVTQSLVHNLDRASWALKDAAPLKCHGMGGRSTLQGEKYGSVFDHHAVVYEFPDYVRVWAGLRPFLRQREI